MLDLSNMPLEGKLTLDILSQASQIELSCAEYLLPAPKGIYVRNRLEPVMVDGQNYYTRSGTETLPVIDVNVTTENIYTEDNRLVVPKTFLLKREKFLSNEPMLPYRGEKILEVLINDMLDERCRWRKHRTNYKPRLLAHFSSDYVGDNKLEDQLLDNVDMAWLDVRKEIDLFIGSKEWNIYFVKLEGSKVHVERYCDWRVYMWEQQHGEEFRQNKYP